MFEVVFLFEGYFKILSASFETKYSEQCDLYARCGPHLWLRPSTSLMNHKGVTGQQERSKGNVLWHGNSQVLLEMKNLTLLCCNIGEVPMFFMFSHSRVPLGCPEQHRGSGVSQVSAGKAELIIPAAGQVLTRRFTPHCHHFWMWDGGAAPSAFPWAAYTVSLMLGSTTPSPLRQQPRVRWWLQPTPILTASCGNSQPSSQSIWQTFSLLINRYF